MATKVTSMKLEIYQNSNWIEYGIFDNKFKITQQIDVFEGKIKDTIVDLSVFYSNSLYNYLIQNKNVNARIYVNNSIVFSGYIECKLKVIRSTKLPEKIDLNIIGLFNKLRKKYKLIKKYSSKTPAYIINDLLSITGLSLYSTPAGLSDVTLTKTFDLSVTTPAEIVEKLLFECGYTGYEVCDINSNSNKIKIDVIKQNLPTSYIYKENIVDGTYRQVVNEVILTKELNDADEISIKYYELGSFSNQILFEDTTNQNSIYRCYIAIAPNSYYQDNSSGVYLDLTYHKSNQSFEIFDISSATLTIQKDSDIQVVESYLSENNRYFVKIKNNSATQTRYIYCLQVKATGTYKKSINFQKIDVSDGEKKVEYEMKYIQNTTKSQNLCDSLAHLYKYSNYKVTFDCVTHNGLFSKITLDTVKGLGTLNCLTTKISIEYELNKNIVYNTENYLIGDVITYTVNNDRVLQTNPISDIISNSQQTPTSTQTLLIDNKVYTDEDNDNVYLSLDIMQNDAGQKFLSITKRYVSSGEIKSYSNLRVKNLELMAGRILADTVATDNEVNLRNIADTDFIGLDAKYFKVQDTEVIDSNRNVKANSVYQNNNKVIYQNSNSEVEAAINKLIAYKELVVGADGEYQNWITNTTPVLRQRDTTNTEYYYLIINTKIIASNYTGGSNTMFDVVLKTFSYGGGSSNWYNNQQMQVRFTGYIYYSGSTYTIYKFRAHILGSNHYNIYAGAYVDNTNGYLHLFLYSPDQYFSAYYRYSEVFFNNYYSAKKAYIDSWDISYTDSISGYDTNFGIMYAKCGGEVMSYCSGTTASMLTLSSISVPASTSYTKYFTLYRDCLVRISYSYSSGSSYVLAMDYMKANYIGNMVEFPIDAKFTFEFLPAGRYRWDVYNSSGSAGIAYIYAAQIKGYAPYSMWSASDIISSLGTSW